MGTRELIKAVQTNVLANYIITHPVNLQARQKPAVANDKLRLVFFNSLSFMLLPVIYFDAFRTLHKCTGSILLKKFL